MTNLSVNINSVAYLRNRRNLPWPDLSNIAQIVLNAGASGITVHPRPDERHICRRDVTVIGNFIKSEFPDREFNIEGYPTEDFLRLVERHLPDQVTLVPDKPEQKTSDHGWDFEADDRLLTQTCARLQKSGMRVSLFINPEKSSAEMAGQIGADRVELYTGSYGACFEERAQKRLLDQLVVCANAARDVGLQVNAGHDLTLVNLGALLGKASFIAEVSIGHAIAADALIYGFDQATRLYLELIRKSQGDIAQGGCAHDTC